MFLLGNEEMLKKIDFKKEFKELYRASDKKISYVNVPKLKFLSIKGKGHPEKSAEFEGKIGALYGMAYTLKFMLKEPSLQPEGYFEFVVPPLETFWYMKDDVEFDISKPEDWRWTMMIIQADYISEELVQKAKDELIKKGKDTGYLEELTLKSFTDGKAVQMMHIGPYNEVGGTIEKLLEELENNELTPARNYREIYLSDPRRVVPEKLKTICRMPYE